MKREKRKEDYYKPAKVGNFWNRNYVEYESNGHRNKTQSIEEYRNKIRPYLKDIVNDLKKTDTCKIQLRAVVSFMSSNDNE